MTWTYANCRNLTGSPICGDNVTDMNGTYQNCYNLTGNPVCGNNVQYMSNTYQNCYNLTGSPVCGNNVTRMSSTYQNCYNLSGNMYFYSNNIRDISNCFYGRNTSNRLNLYVHINSTTNTTLHNKADNLVGKPITWTNAGSYQYNTAFNIYIYPVVNVEAMRVINGDPNNMGVI